MTEVGGEGHALDLASLFSYITENNKNQNKNEGSIVLGLRLEKQYLQGAHPLVKVMVGLTGVCICADMSAFRGTQMLQG